MELPGRVGKLCRVLIDRTQVSDALDPVLPSLRIGPETYGQRTAA